MEVGATSTGLRASPAWFAVRVPHAREREWKGVLTMLCQLLIFVTHVKGLRALASLYLAFQLPLASTGSVLEPADIGSVGHGGNMRSCFQLFPAVSHRSHPCSLLFPKCFHTNPEQGLAGQCDLEREQQCIQELCKHKRCSASPQDTPTPSGSSPVSQAHLPAALHSPGWFGCCLMASSTVL